MKLQQFAKIKPIPPKTVENNKDINKNITDNITISTLYLNITLRQKKHVYRNVLHVNTKKWQTNLFSSATFMVAEA